MGAINRSAQITISSSCSLFTGSLQNHEHPLRLLSNSSQGNVPQRSQLTKEFNNGALTTVTPSFTDGTWGLVSLEVKRTKKLSHIQGQGRALTHNVSGKKSRKCGIPLSPHKEIRPNPHVTVKLQKCDQLGSRSVHWTDALTYALGKFGISVPSPLRFFLWLIFLRLISLSVHHGSLPPPHLKHGSFSGVLLLNTNSCETACSYLRQDTEGATTNIISSPFSQMCSYRANNPREQLTLSNTDDQANLILSQKCRIYKKKAPIFLILTNVLLLGAQCRLSGRHVAVWTRCLRNPEQGLSVLR